MRILLPLDGSTFAEQALPAAQKLAAVPGAEVHLLAIVRSPETDGLRALVRSGAGDSEEDTSAALLARSEALTGDVVFVVAHYLEDVARHFPSAIVRPTVTVGDAAAREIEEYAQTNGIGLIVMATHARAGLNAAIHGGVAADVLRSGVAPVVLVRPAAGEAVNAFP